jgi:DNA primase
MFDIEAFLKQNFKCSVSGENLVFNCPFCVPVDTGFNYWFRPNKTFVSRKTQRQYSGVGQCFKCGQTHSVITFIMHYKNYDFMSALAFIEGDRDITSDSLLEMMKQVSKSSRVDKIEDIKDLLDAGIDVPLPHGSTTNLPSEIIDWFVNKRSYPEEMLKWLGVCYTSEWKNNLKLYGFKGRAIFPIESGSNKAWQAYLYKKGVMPNGKKLSKTYNPPGSIMRSLLYLYDLVKDDKIILVNEGIFDSLRCFTRGYSPVCLFGKNLSFTQAYLLSKTKSEEIVICLDGGVKEEAEAMKAAFRLQYFYDNDISVMKLPHGVDPDDVDEKTFSSCFKNRTSIEWCSINNDLHRLSGNYTG